MSNIENKRPGLPLRSARHILSSLALFFVFGSIGIGSVNVVVPSDPDSPAVE